MCDNENCEGKLLSADRTPFIRIANLNLRYFNAQKTKKIPSCDHCKYQLTHYECTALCGIVNWKCDGETIDGAAIKGYYRINDHSEYCKIAPDSKGKTSVKAEIIRELVTFPIIPTSQQLLHGFHVKHQKNQQ